MFLRTPCIVIFLGFALGALVAACGDDGALDSGPDGAMDARPNDTGPRDTAPRDIRMDTTEDTASDPVADAVTGETRWIPLEGLPEGCVIERAENPDTLLDNRWVPCGDAEGCLTLVEDPRFQRARDSRVGATRDGVGYFSVVEGLWSEVERQRIVVLAATDGRVVGAWRDPLFDGRNTCHVGSPATDGDQAGIFVNVRLQTGPHLTAIYRGTVDTLASLSTPTQVLTSAELGGLNIVQTLHVSGSTLAAQVAPVFLWTLQGDERRKLSHRGSPIEGSPENTQVVGEHVIWEEWGGQVRVAHGSIDQEGAPFIQILDGEVKGFRTDGETMVWQQLYDRNPDSTYDRIELWTAPYVRNPEDIDARMVRRLPSRAPQVTYGAGVYGFDRGDDVYTLIDVTDGRTRTLTLPDRVAGFTKPLYISTEEIMIGTFQGLRRYDLSLIPYDE